MARILVTGGAGFIGSHLCERLVSEGNDVICLDNFYTGTKNNVAHLRERASFELVRHDVTEAILLEVDQIYHLACAASPVHYQANPIKTLKTSFQGTANMLGLAKRTDARILFASTSEIYGDPLQHPQTESYWGNVNPIGPRSCYDEGKRVAETLVMEYNRNNGVDTRIVRIFNTYGPRMMFNDGRVVSNFVYQALCSKPITLYGDGQQTRSFCFVDDLVDGLVRAMNKEGFKGPVNLGNPQEITVKELAERILKITGSASPLVFEPLPVDDPLRRKPDISLAKAVLEWEPRVELEVGLKTTVKNFSDRLNKNPQ